MNGAACCKLHINYLGKPCGSALAESCTQQLWKRVQTASAPCRNEGKPRQERGSTHAWGGGSMWGKPQLHQWPWTASSPLVFRTGTRVDPVLLSPDLMHPQLLHLCCMWPGNRPQPDVPSCSPAVHISPSLTADQALPSPRPEQRNLQVKHDERFSVPAEQQKALCVQFLYPLSSLKFP